LERDDEPGALGQGLTATDPDYMGRGIAWALKLFTVRYAQERGYERIKTWNDSENHTMLSINLRLGFAPRPAWITVERAVQSRESRVSRAEIRDLPLAPSGKGGEEQDEA
jgi:GNAT superfamily N-acetyltransferase